jgi:monoterpene epsilon-lactone hydrolase
VRFGSPDGRTTLANCLLAAALPLLLSASRTFAQDPFPQTNSSFIDASGTAHVTRVVPVPLTVSPEAQRAVASSLPDVVDTETLAGHRARVDAWQSEAAAKALTLYPVNMVESTVAGVPVRVVTPLSVPERNAACVLINFHGGGFKVDSGSFTEPIPIANLTRIKVVSVLYRLAPEHPFPAAVDDAVAVYRDMLKNHEARHIGIYGSSAGAELTAEVAVRLHQLGLPLPGALGIFSGSGDFSKVGDSRNFFSIHGLAGHIDGPGTLPDPEYVGSTDRRDPVLSPIYADLRGMPPALFVTSTRDQLLSGTVNLHRAFLRAGVDARLVVFEALNHTFWNDFSLPESREAFRLMAHFFDDKLGAESGD